jgi:predicted  nucleic acid-binding Zn-ribbon protein
MKMARPTVPPPNLDSPEARAFIEGAASSSSEQVPAHASEKKTMQKPANKREHRRKQNSETRNKMLLSSTKKTAAKAAANKKELVIPDSIVIDDKAVGKFLLEVPKVLRQKIKQKSLDTGKSMNELIITVLSQAFD